MKKKTLFLGLGTVAKQVKPLPAGPAFHMDTDLVPGSPTSNPDAGWFEQKVAENASSTWVPALTQETWRKPLGLGLGLEHLSSLQQFGD